MKIQTILPFHPSIAEQIQKGEKQGSITLIHSQEPWRLIHIIGEENLRLQSIEDPSDMRTVDRDTPKHFVCRLIEEVADIPENLKGRETVKPHMTKVTCFLVPQRTALCVDGSA